jgi:predicted nucleotidyltransferase
VDDVIIQHNPGTPDYSQFIIYSCIVGSRAYGLDTDESDTDRRGIYLPPAELHWSIRGVPEQIVIDENQTTYWELQKFIRLALKSNPTVLECLFTPLVEHASPIAQELRERRSIFLSQLVYQSYNNYVLSQFRKQSNKLEAGKAGRPKHAMHLIRLLLAGIGIMRDGTLTVQIEEHRDQLLEIRRGEMTWQEVNEWRGQLHAEFEALSHDNTLPMQPDYDAANDILIRARRSMV